ncbi:MAG TPA: hypothetical protein VIY71_05925 [Solirubrobacterales bacterium]
MARRVGRAQQCSAQDARSRRDHARKFLEVAELAADEHEQDPEYASVAVSLAVLSGIAAADAACCKALGERSRGQDHHDAEKFLQRIVGGEEAARELRALLDLKDEANYGFFNVSAAELRRALRRTRALLEFADRVLSR